MAIKFTEQAVVTASDSYDKYKKLKEQLEKVDSQYDTTYKEPELDLPESLNLEKLQYTMPTQQEIENLAKQENISDYISKNQQLDSKIEDYKLTNSQKQQTVNEEKKAKDDQLREQLQQELKSIGNRTIDNGIARSSITTGAKQQAKEVNDATRKQYAEQFDTELQQLASQLAQQLADTDEQRKILQETFQNEVLNSVAKLTAEAQKKYDDTVKYNNTVDEKEAKYQADREEQLFDARQDEYQRINDLIELYSKVGETGIEARKTNEKLQYVKEFFDSVDKQTALSILNSDNTLQAHLGMYYDYIVDYVNNKKD